VVPLDTTPPGHSKEAQPSQTPSKKETGKETREVIKLNERKILPDSKKIDLTSGQGMHTVQVGSYRSKMQASTLVEKLNKKGYPAYLIEASIPQKGLWYRIRVGYFQTREEAEKISSEIKEKEKLFNYVTLSSK
jgi:cell division septation protein DedD